MGLNQYKNIPVRSWNLNKLNGTTRRPFREYDRGWFHQNTWFWRCILNKIPNPRYGANRHFQRSPGFYHLGKGLIERESKIERNADGACSESVFHRGHRSDNDDCDRTYNQVQDQLQPYMNAEEHIKRFLRIIQVLSALIPKSCLPSKGMNGRETVDSLNEMVVQWSFGLNVYESNLAGSSQVIPLDEK